MSKLDTLLSERFPGAKIESGAVVAEFCRIDPGCEISAGTVIKQKVALCANVHTHGEVLIEIGAVIRENVTLVGPLHIKEDVFIGHDSIIGASREDEQNVRETVVEANARIGKEVEIVGGVQIGEGARIRAKSTVIGDVPACGLASRSPAILERYICPTCGSNLRINGSHLPQIHVVCNRCHHPPIVMNADDWSKIPMHVLLPNHQIGEDVSILGDDPRWLDEWEIR